MQRIGLYGGSFDPVHFGHILVGQAAVEELNLTRLIYLPAARSPFKTEKPPAPAEQRLAMLRLALAGHANCQVDDCEVQRGGTSFTIDTVRHFAGRFPDANLFYLIGADNVPTLLQWRSAMELAGLVEMIVVPRPGESPVFLPPPFRGHYLRGFPFGVASSQIRRRIKSQLSIDLLTPVAVAEFIRNNRLYL